ncbi:hypothetical protein PAECIP111890_04878 [Paenibacillus sp. JJ-223]|nr:hypothetical protein PAECIP111890_04878 [Paenibacillus sp. JJ-223]
MACEVQGSESARSYASINFNLVSAYHQTVNYLNMNTRNHPQSSIHICPFLCIGSVLLTDFDATKHR